MKADDRALADLAASVADGTAIDWHSAESTAGASGRRLVRHLRLVDNIAALYRSIPPEPADEEPAMAGAHDRNPPAAAEPAGPRWGRLVLLEQIGHGTSCEVFRAWDSNLHREVALKLLRDPATDGRASRETHARVLREARRLARVRHAHVVQVYGAEEHDGRVGLWMELVRGESLEQIVAGRGPFGPREAAVIGQDLCAALSAVHAAGLVHRDIKAQNVLRESGGRTVLMDFGTGEELHDARGTARMAGTPLYLAPEIFAGKPASVQSDLYGLGVLLFYLVTGQFPVTAGSIEQLARAHADGHTRRLRDLRPDLPVSFVRVIERALDRDPAARYLTAGEMEAALREGADRFQEPAVTAPRPRILPRPLMVASIAAALALATAVAATVWSRAGAITHVAVLPLADVSGPSATPYFADALTDQLIATLGQVSALRVSSSTSVMRFKESRPSLEQIVERLGVDALVEGTIAIVPDARGASRVRVNARLISAGGDVLWSRTFERAAGETLVLQADLARAIADGVNAVVTAQENRRLSDVRPTSAAAEQAYFQGLYNLNQLGADNILASIEAFGRATELDANHALAHAGLARAHITLGFMRVTSQAEARISGLAAATRAVTLDPESGAAHQVLADLKFYYDWDWAAADAGYQKAIELNPGSSRTHSQYARYLIARGRTASALDEAERAAELDPLSPGTASTQALMYYFTRDYDRAIDRASRALQLDPRSPGVYFILSRIHAARGALHDAVAANERAISLSGRPPMGWRAHRVVLDAHAGSANEARTALRKLTEEAESQGQRIGAHLAYIQLALGNRQEALQLLERAAEDRDPDLLWLAVDPRVDPLRHEPRFQQLLSVLGLPHLTRQSRYP